LCALAAALAFRRQTTSKLSIKGEKQARHPVSKVEWAALAGFIALAVVYVSPRMTQTLWNDEQVSIGTSIVGETLLDIETGLPERYKSIGWLDVWFGYKNPSNHVVYSACARALHDIAPPTEAEGGWYFREWTMRIPALVCALAALALLWILVRRELGAAAGWATAFIFAASPWWVRYSTEARGYGMLLGWATLLLLCGRRALRRGDLASWAWVGVAEFLAIYTWPLAAHFVFWVNVGLATHLYSREPTWAQRWAAMRPWLSTGMVALACLLPLCLPLLAQLRVYLRYAYEQLLDAKDPSQILSHLLTGRPIWRKADVLPAEYHPTWNDSPWHWVMFGCLLGVFVIGLAAWWKRREMRWMLLPALLTPVSVVSLAHSNGVFYIWYLLLSFPLIAAIFGLGTSTIASASARLLRHSNAAPFCTGLLCLGFLAAFHPVNAVYIHVPAEPLRQAAEIIGAPRFFTPQSQENKQAPIVGLNLAHQIYFPTGRRVTNKAQMQAAIADARTNGRKFYYVENMYGREVGRGTEIGAFLADPTQFRTIWSHQAFMKERPIAVHEWIGKKTD
jgi:hypothetical protein